MKDRSGVSQIIHCILQDAPLELVCKNILRSTTRKPLPLAAVGLPEGAARQLISVIKKVRLGEFCSYMDVPIDVLGGKGFNQVDETSLFFLNGYILRDITVGF